MEQAKAQFVEKLYIEHAPALYRTCLNRLNHRHEYDAVIEESVQDTFVQCYLSYEKLLDHPCIEGWLHKTCWYKLSKHQKKHDRHRGKQIPLEQFESFLFEQSNQQNALEDREALRELMQNLSQKELHVFMNRYLNGQRIWEIADRMDVSQSTVKDSLRKIRSLLAQIMSGLLIVILPLAIQAVKVLID